MEQQTSIQTYLEYRMTPMQEYSTQQPAMTIQGALFEQSNLKLPVEPPAMSIPPKLPHSQIVNTYSNARGTPDDTSKNLLTPKQAVYASWNVPFCRNSSRKNSLQRTGLRKLWQHDIAWRQIDGNTTGASRNAHPLPEATPTLISWLQLLNYACHSQIKSKLARTCRSLPLDSVCNNSQYSLATRPISNNQQSPAFIALNIHNLLQWCKNIKWR